GEAVVSARALIAREPQILSAWGMLSDSLERTGRLADSIEALRRGIAAASKGTVGEHLSQAYDNLSLLQKKARDPAGQEKALREAVARGVASEPMKRDLAR